MSLFARAGVCMLLAGCSLYGSKSDDSKGGVTSGGVTFGDAAPFATGLDAPRDLAIDERAVYLVTDGGRVLAVPFAGGAPVVLATGQPSAPAACRPSRTTTAERAATSTLRSRRKARRSRGRGARAAERSSAARRTSPTAFKSPPARARSPRCRSRARTCTGAPATRSSASRRARRRIRRPSGHAA